MYISFILYIRKHVLQCLLWNTSSYIGMLFYDHLSKEPAINPHGIYYTESTMDTALRPKSPLSQASVNTTRFVSPLQQATDSGKGAPTIQIKWLNSPECYTLSTRRTLPWFVLISEYKSVGNKPRSKSRGFPCLHLSAEWPDHRVVKRALCCFFPVLMDL